MKFRTRRALTAEIEDLQARIEKLIDPDLHWEKVSAELLADGGVHAQLQGRPDQMHPAVEILIGACAAFLQLDMGEPPNYQTAEIEIRPRGRVEPFTLSMTVIKPGGKSPHVLRQEADANLVKMARLLQRCALALVAEALVPVADPVGVIDDQAVWDLADELAPDLAGQEPA